MSKTIQKKGYLEKSRESIGDQDFGSRMWKMFMKNAYEREYRWK